jgi:hypothetical protein
MRGSYAMAPRSPVDLEATKNAEKHLMDASLEAHKQKKTALEKEEADYKAALAASLEGIFENMARSSDDGIVKLTEDERCDQAFEENVGDAHRQAAPETAKDKARRKKYASVAAIKRSEEYRLYIAGEFSMEALLHHIPEPTTPDPEADVSKRQWESNMMTWRNILKICVGKMSVADLSRRAHSRIFRVWRVPCGWSRHAGGPVASPQA